MTRVKLKEQYISYLSLLQTFNNISVIMLLHTFNIISPILDVRRGDYVIVIKVTTALWMSNFDQKVLSAPYLLNQIMYSGQTLYIVSLW